MTIPSIRSAEVGIAALLNAVTISLFYLLLQFLYSGSHIYEID